ncbi:MAG: hypothetical protein Q4D04_13970 [Clostridia bacterium]|nr:hypothetical protein [Clostridia bacterium]
MKRKEPDWKRAYGPVPETYAKQFEKTLSELKGERTVNMKTAMRTVLIAAILLILLVGTALAVGSALGIIDFFEQNYGMTPSEDAAATISRNLATTDDGLIRFTVREAVYDGETVRALLAVEPFNAQKYIVANDISDIIEIEDGKTAEECADEYAQTSGRTILTLADTWIDIDNAVNYTSTSCTARDGDAVLSYCAISLSDESPETVQLVANAEILDDSVNTLSFSLDKTSASIRALSPHEVTDGGVTILSANLSQTPFADYMRVVYQPPGISFEQIAQTFADDATYYMTKHGMYAHADPTCSGMANAEAATYQEVIAAKKLPCPICAGGDMALMAGGEVWTIELLDEEGKAIEIAGTSGSDANGSIAGGTYSQLIVIRSGSLPDGNLYVRFTAPDGTPYSPILLK